MDTVTVLNRLRQGEDSRTQFKQTITNSLSLAAEMVAFSNTQGGDIFVGVGDNGNILGLSIHDCHRINQLVSNTGSDCIRPAINPITEITIVDNKRILIITVDSGLLKPYQYKNGTVWVKTGADKRKATSQEAMQRMFQRSGLLYGDQVPIEGATLDDIDIWLFKDFLKKVYDEDLDHQLNSPLELLTSMSLAKAGVINRAGLLLFGKNNAFKLPTCLIRCVSYPGKDVGIDQYIDSQDNTGTVLTMYTDTIGFLMRNIRHIQGDQGVNSIGKPEIPQRVFQELVANALIHRDYFISAVIRVFVFSDRIEIISPGHLPNDLSVINIKSGNSKIRNQILASYATKVLPYRGLGTGIKRVLAAYPDVDFIDDREGNQFTCIIKRQTLAYH